MQVSRFQQSSGAGVVVGWGVREFAVFVDVVGGAGPPTLSCDAELLVEVVEVVEVVGLIEVVEVAETVLLLKGTSPSALTWVLASCMIISPLRAVAVVNT
jgi:hypothetical protein